jgi:hypothetical protein
MGHSGPADVSVTRSNDRSNPFVLNSSTSSAL